MKKYILAVAFASSAFFSLPVQAAPAMSSAPVQSLIQSGAELVRHCRYWSDGYNCGYGGGHEEHSRDWSHRRHGSGGYGGYEGGDHSRYWSHKRHGSWKRDF